MADEINIDATNGTAPLVNIEVPDSAMLGALNKYNVASLPVGAIGQVAFAIDGRDVGEGAGAGTGVPVYFKNGNWYVFYAKAIVSS